MPTDGTVTLADGTTPVTAGEVLTVAQLTGLKFTPAASVFNGSSTLTYTVTDPDHNASTGTATLKTGSVAPSVFSASLTAAENSAATPIGIAAPTDPVYPASQLTVTVGTLPTDGTVTLADGVTPLTAGEILTVAQLTGLEFTPTQGAFATSSSFSYSVTDPEQNSSSATATLAIGPALGNPVVSSSSLVVAQGAAATAIGIAAPTDPNYAASQLTITVATLPSNGTVTLADGTTAVHAGQTLTVAQLTGLEFKPATGTPQTASAFAYTVKDPTGNTSTGTATVTIQPTPFGDLTVSGTVTPILASGEALFAGGVTVNVFADPRVGRGRQLLRQSPVVRARERKLLPRRASHGAAR